MQLEVEKSLVPFVSLVKCVFLKVLSEERRPTAPGFFWVAAAGGGGCYPACCECS